MKRHSLAPASTDILRPHLYTARGRRHYHCGSLSRGPRRRWLRQLVLPKERHRHLVAASLPHHATEAQQPYRQRHAARAPRSFCGCLVPRSHRPLPRQCAPQDTRGQMPRAAGRACGGWAAAVKEARGGQQRAKHSRCNLASKIWVWRQEQKEVQAPRATGANRATRAYSLAATSRVQAGAHREHRLAFGLVGLAWLQHVSHRPDGRHLAHTVQRAGVAKFVLDVYLHHQP